MNISSPHKRYPKCPDPNDVKYRFNGGSLPFIWHYIFRERRRFLLLFALVLLAAGCAVAVQYEMKVVVDAMAGQTRAIADVAAS